MPRRTGGDGLTHGPGARCDPPDQLATKPRGRTGTAALDPPRGPKILVRLEASLALNPTRLSRPDQTSMPTMPPTITPVNCHGVRPDDATSKFPLRLGVVGRCFVGLLAAVMASNARAQIMFNGGFEQNHGLPACGNPINTNNFSASLASGWTLGTGSNSPDYFHTSTGNIGCLNYSPSPRSGNAHIGIAMGNPANGSYREYLRGGTTTTLASSNRYFVEFFARRVDGNVPATLGVHFSIGAPGNPLGLAPQVSRLVGSTAGYASVSGVFDPPVSTNYTVTIGAFNTDPVTSLNYFYVDDVAITPCASLCTVTQQPQSSSLTVGANVNFSVQTAGSATPTFRWRKNGVDLPTNLPNEYGGVTASTLTVFAADYGDVGSYDVTIGYPCGTLNSDVAQLYCSVAPIFLGQPADVNITSGQTATFQVFASSMGTGPIQYRWQNISRPGAYLVETPGVTTGTATDTLVVYGRQTSTAYRCEISNACATVASRWANLVVTKNCPDRVLGTIVGNGDDVMLPIRPIGFAFPF
ncbi:MAG: immunoglobulin domain-containing protein, partial [Planctomycetes bacterium]|nr:immunoglobulin domain-containing protein [Planctomycetota bacterium]